MEDFGEKMNLMGKIEALLKLELNIQAEVKLLNAELEKLKEEQE